jgi:STE24 endopeptidase
MPWNIYAILVLVILVGFYLLDTFAELLNLRALRPELPMEFRDVYDPQRYEQSQRYTRVNTWLGLAEDSVWLIAFLLFWRLGGFAWVDRIARGVSEQPVAAGLVFFGILGALRYALGLPFSVISTFGVEEHFGFNRTTLKTYLLDQIKSLLLSALLGGAILAAIVALFSALGAQAWILVWIAISAFSLILGYLAPRLILPWFYRFQPLEPGELRDRIYKLAEACRFPVREIWVMDGSQRSTKSNAFFTGFGRNKRVVLFDTLVKQHSTDELVAVLAHEIGHYKKRHLVQQMSLGLLQVGLMTFLLGQMLESRALAAAFGLQQPSVYASIALFGILFRPISRLVGLFSSILSRRHEYQADRFAAQAVGQPGWLASALKRLSADNLVNLTPHPFYVFLNDSHPPMLERIDRLRGHQGREAASAAT